MKCNLPPRFRTDTFPLRNHCNLQHLSCPIRSEIFRRGIQNNSPSLRYFDISLLRKASIRSNWSWTFLFGMFPPCTKCSRLEKSCPYLIDICLQNRACKPTHCCLSDMYRKYILYSFPHTMPLLTPDMFQIHTACK